MTKDNSKVFDFIVQSKREHDGNSPTYREIADACGYSTASAAKYAVNSLVEEGKLRVVPEMGSRHIEVVGALWLCSAGPSLGIATFAELT